MKHTFAAILPLPRLAQWGRRNPIGLEESDIPRDVEPLRSGAWGRERKQARTLIDALLAIGTRYPLTARRLLLVLGLTLAYGAAFASLPAPLAQALGT